MAIFIFPRSALCQSFTFITASTVFVTDSCVIQCCHDLIACAFSLISVHNDCQSCTCPALHDADSLLFYPFHLLFVFLPQAPILHGVFFIVVLMARDIGLQ